MNTISRYNMSGAADPTAYAALTPIQAAQDAEQERVNRLIRLIKTAVDLAGFDLIARIEIRSRASEKIYR